MNAKIVPGTVVATLLAFGGIAGCSNMHKYPDVSSQILNSLDQAGLKDVSVSQDRDKGSSYAERRCPMQTADKLNPSQNPFASAEVVSDQIAVRPPGDESTAKKVDSDLDKGIEKNFDPVLVRHKLYNSVKYDVKNGVITLTGKVKSQSQREGVEKIASGVPNVRQVVNELEVK